MGTREEIEQRISGSLLGYIEDRYHIIGLVGIVVAMFAMRIQTYSNFIRDGEVFFSGNDAWYHFREVVYITEHWPTPIPFDPWTGFPTGQWVGQFGTLYDQLIATIALIIGLGSPSEALIGKVLLIAPAVAGALTAIPVYIVGKRLSGRLGGLLGATVLLLLPGTFLRRTLVGVADHNAVEPLVMMLAVAGFVIAFQKASESMPIWEVVYEELITEQQLDSLTDPLKWSLLAGFSLGIYIWTWPPAVFFIGIIALFTFIKLTSDVLHEQTPEPTAFVVATSMLVVAFMSLIAIDRIQFDTVALSLLQPLAATVVALEAIGLSWLARQWEQREIDTTLYPVAVGAVGITGVGVISILGLGIVGLITNNLLRIAGFSAGATARTIGEAQPFVGQTAIRRSGGSIPGRIAVEYGFTFFSGVAAAFVLHAKPLLKRGTQRVYGYLLFSVSLIGVLFLVPSLLDFIESMSGVDEQVAGLLIVSGLIIGATGLTTYDADRLFIVVWAAFITAMAFTQVRFNYYLASVVAVFNAYLFSEVLRYLNLNRSFQTVIQDIDGYQILAVSAAILLVLAPVLAVPITLGNTTTTPAWEAAQSNGPGSVTVWDESLTWMQNNTPEEGNLGGAGNQDEMAYYGEYTFTDDFSYPEGAYGVMSWWDYGHWITVQGERIPNANPFQQGATTAANFLLSPNETQAGSVLNSQSTEGDQTRYVMVDWQMATPGSKFGAPTVFYDAESNVSRSDFLSPVYRFNAEGRFAGTASIRTPRFYNSTMTKLYYYHGSAQNPSPIVVDWQKQQVQTNDGGSTTVNANPSGNSSIVRTFNSTRQAQSYLANDSTSQLGGIGAFPTHRVSALEHYRLVHVSDTSALRNIAQTSARDARVAGVSAQATLPDDSSWVKTFERVPGAKVEGENGPPNSTVTAEVELKIPNKNSTFTYRQQAQTNRDGEFSMTLPYSTTEYEQYGPESGYTDVSVRANSSYTVSSTPTFNESGYIVSYRSNLSVPEGTVNGDQSQTLRLSLDRRAQELTLGGEDTSESETIASDQ